MLDAISAALRSVDPTARKRLVRCIPALNAALARLGALTGGLTLACATPRSAIVLSSEGWPDLGATKFDRADAALALAAAIENEATDAVIVITAAAVLLGEQALAAHAADTAEIVRCGQWPLTILLVERRGSNIAMVCTVTGVDAATVH